MDAGVLLPMNTFTAYENLRKFYRSGGEGEDYFRIMRRMMETGYRRDVSYSEYLSSVLQLRETAARERELAWLLSTLQKDAESEQGREVRSVHDRFFREFAVRTLISAWQTGARELVRNRLMSFTTVFPSWPERGLLDLLMTPPAEDAAAHELLVSSVDSDTRDAFLMMTAGSLHERYRDVSSAAELYDRALRSEPAAYPSWYLVAARFHLEVRRDTTAARSVLESCIRNAPRSDEARQAEEQLRLLR
ncbi:MAG: hypothetical protein JXA28_06260 [Bacteroidetes bacterium]|nr:hypothetical protein [Bacteroidota bacterium]